MFTHSSQPPVVILLGGGVVAGGDQPVPATGDVAADAGRLGGDVSGTLLGLGLQPDRLKETQTARPGPSETEHMMVEQSQNNNEWKGQKFAFSQNSLRYFDTFGSWRFVTADVYISRRGRSSLVEKRPSCIPSLWTESVCGHLRVAAQDRCSSVGSLPGRGLTAVWWYSAPVSRCL